MLRLDHIAVACTDLAQGADWVQDQLGVTLHPGGQHLRYGTHNLLLGLGDLYLEVIALDPAAARDGPAWFGLDHFAGPPRLANWICQADDPGADPALTGPVQQLQRGDLRWEITVPADGSLPFDGAYPTLIRWAEGTRHPATRLPDSGLRLTRWEVHHPEADKVRRLADLDDPRVVFVNESKGFRAVFDAPDGPRVLA